MVAPAAGYLCWNGIALDKVAFQPRDLRQLLGKNYRGGNLSEGGVAGRTAYAPVLDQIDVTLTWIARGDYTYSGALSSNARDQLDLNLIYYKALFTENGAVDTGLVTSRIVLPSRTVTSSAQCWDWDERSNVKGNLAVVTTRIVVPAGLWTTVT